MATNQLIETDSEDELPAGWEERVTLEGKVYYANHELKSTQWEHPTTSKRKKVSGELPFGWEKKVNDEGNVYFVDHVHKKTTFTDPRLAFAVEDRNEDMISRNTIKQRFDGATYAMTVLMGRDLTGKYAIVTGANSGIGFETARALALHGAHVVLACRDMEKGRQAARLLRTERPTGVNITVMRLDLNHLGSVKQFCDTYIKNEWPCHYLVLNAGVFAPPYTLTADGYEATFQTNHLGHFHLTRLLTDVLVQSSPARVVVVSAESHRFSDLCVGNLSEEKLSPPYALYESISAYNTSKLCNLLFSNELNRRLHDKGVVSNAVHPGNVVNTGISRHWWVWRLVWALVRPFTKTKSCCMETPLLGQWNMHSPFTVDQIVDKYACFYAMITAPLHQCGCDFQGQAAATSVFAATARELEGYGGYFFNSCFNVDPAPAAKNPELACLLWEMSEQMVAKATTLRSPGQTSDLTDKVWGEKPPYEQRLPTVKVV